MISPRCFLFFELCVTDPDSIPGLSARDIVSGADVTIDDGLSLMGLRLLGRVTLPQIIDVAHRAMPIAAMEKTFRAAVESFLVGICPVGEDLLSNFGHRFGIFEG